VQTYAIDESRVLLTGFSLGAAGGWELAAEHAERFAGFVPVSGKVPEHFGPPEFRRLRELPVWAFNGEFDERAGPAQAQAAIAALQALGGRARHTTVAAGDHFIEDAVYPDPILQAWWLGQRRLTPAAA